MTPLTTYFSKTRLMARFESHQGVSFHEEEDVIGDLEVLDLLFFFQKWTPIGATETEPSV